MHEARRSPERMSPAKTASVRRGHDGAIRRCERRVARPRGAVKSRRVSSAAEAVESRALGVARHLLVAARAGRSARRPVRLGEHATPAPRRERDARGARADTKSRRAFAERNASVEKGSGTSTRQTHLTSARARERARRCTSEKARWKRGAIARKAYLRCGRCMGTRAACLEVPRSQTVFAVWMSAEVPAVRQESNNSRI